MKIKNIMGEKKRNKTNKRNPRKEIKEHAGTSHNVPAVCDVFTLCAICPKMVENILKKHSRMIDKMSNIHYDKQ